MIRVQDPRSAAEPHEVVNPRNEGGVVQTGDSKPDHYEAVQDEQQFADCVHIGEVDASLFPSRASGALNPLRREKRNCEIFKKLREEQVF